MKCISKNKRNYFYKETDELGGDDPTVLAKLVLIFYKCLVKIKTKKSNFCNVRSGNIIGGGDGIKKDYVRFSKFVISQ